MKKGGSLRLSVLCGVVYFKFSVLSRGRITHNDEHLNHGQADLRPRRRCPANEGCGKELSSCVEELSDCVARGTKANKPQTQVTLARCWQ